jgi:hypothetical protein
VGTFLTATAVHGWLSQAREQFVAYHRIEMKLGKLRLGIAEGVRYDAAAPEPYYLLNIIPYSTVEKLLSSEGLGRVGYVGVDRDSLFRSNYMISTDLYWNPTPGWAFYGEFLIDDIMRDDGLFDLQPEEGVPVRIGYQFGARHVHEGSRRLTLQAEYTRVYNYTYSVYYDRNFFHSESPLGYPLGPDISDLNFWADLDLNFLWSVSGRVLHQQIGEGNKGGAWCAEGFDAENCQTVGAASGSDFAGVVESRLGFELGVLFVPRDNIRFDVVGGLARVTSVDHVEGDDQTRPTARLQASWRW